MTYGELVDRRSGGDGVRGGGKVMRFMNFIYGLQIPIRDILDKLTIYSVKDLEFPNVH